MGDLEMKMRFTFQSHSNYALARVKEILAVGRQNLTIRMSMRRLTRLTNGFSKKLENLEHAVTLHHMHYNFCRIHQSLRITPATEAGVSDHVWSLDEVINLL
jgi:hypothetical protein